MTANGPVRSVRWAGPDGRAAVVEAAGEIDLHRSADFQRELLETLDAAPRELIVDLSAVPYMDSSGVASLVKLLARVRKSGGALKLAGLTARVRSVFEITRLTSVFDLYPSVESALGT